MDVILDSNIFLSDIRMESIGFKNLFDYLRRTNSKLVIPHLVREEVVYRHAERLNSEGKKALKAIESFNRLVLKKHDRIHFSVPNPKQERPDIRKKFSDFPKGVNVELYRELVNLDIREVYLRGITRKRPANVNGEELRDVILWMIAMQYSVTTKRETAFISRDNGFWDGNSLHPQIQTDIEASKAPLTVFPTIDSFIKQSAPPPRNAELDEINALFDLRTLQKELIPALSDAFRKRQSANKLDWHPLELKLSSATIYDIDQQTSFAELLYSVGALVESTVWVYPMAGPPSLFQQNRTMTLADLNPANSLFGHPAPNPFLGLLSQPPTEGPKILNRWQSVSATVRVLLRLHNKNVSEAEIDAVRIEKMQDAEPAAAASS